ncbi:MAG: hypothetical protein QNJ98_14865 [Planctomycetota bacterium]|nr:hypothetical protein [Planctomycetota bacterium]
MKTPTTPLLVLAIVLGLASFGWADPDAENQAKYEEKIAKPFVAHGAWVLDYDEARERAAKEQKLIFAYFTRSYAR